MTMLGEAVEGLFENPQTIRTANDNIMLRTSPGTIGVSRSPSRTLIQENGVERPVNCSVTVVNLRHEPKSRHAGQCRENAGHTLQVTQTSSGSRFGRTPTPSFRGRFQRPG